MFPRPFADLQRVTPWPPVAAVAITIGLLEELLILGLQLVFENDAMDVRAFLAQPVGFFEVRAVDLGARRQLDLPPAEVVE